MKWRYSHDKYLGFLLQTLEVSLMAIVLLVMKILLKDKLSPRWQYGIWIILLVCLVIPAGMFGKYIVPRLAIYLEAFKGMIETHLSSQFVEAYIPVSNFMFLPFIKTVPHSLTDYLFVIYVLGVIISFCYYVMSYIRLHHVLQKGKEASQYMKERVHQVASQYHLPSCQIVIIGGLPSSFVFGLIKPVLVLPDDDTMDDKIILHELLHLKYKDLWQNVLWSCLMTLHWCNPFLQYCLHLIHNDMESLCDQRVLELIEGEERRDYGRILLSMTNEKYPSAFGTTSLSNGGKFMKERIEAIVRFKKYPRGMSLVSVCIGILLLPLAIGGTASAGYIEQSINDQNSFQYHVFLASARLQQCSTVAGAIDTYAKAYLLEKDAYYISVMPKNQLSHYRDVLKNKPLCMFSPTGEALYYVVNLEKKDQKTYEAYLYFERSYEEYNDNYDESNEEDVEYETITDYTILPIQIIKEMGWKIKLNGEIMQGRLDSFYNNYDHGYVYQHLPSYTYKQTVETGTIELKVQNFYIVNNEMQTDQMLFFENKFFSHDAKPDAKFYKKYQNVEVQYINQQSSAIQDDIKNIGLTITQLENKDDDYRYHYTYELSESSSDGGSAYRALEKDDPRSMTQSYCYIEISENQNIMPHSQCYAVTVRLNDKTVEDIVFELEDHK